MRINLRAIRIIVVLLSLTIVSSVSYGEQYYKWVDENGVTHYGEALPEDNIEHVAFEFPDKYTTYNPADDYYSIQNQLQRLEEWRKSRAETQARREQARAQRQPPAYRYEEPRYVAAPYYPIYYPHLRNKYKHGCRYGRNCYRPAPVHRKGNLHYRKSGHARSTPRRSSSRGIHTGIAARTR